MTIFLPNAVRRQLLLGAQSLVKLTTEADPIKYLFSSFSGFCC